jgi:hypothetical protein
VATSSPAPFGSFGFPFSAAEKMQKLSFLGFLDVLGGVLLYTPLATSLLVVDVSSGGTCENAIDICGITPNGEIVWLEKMNAKHMNSALQMFLVALAGGYEEYAECHTTYVYCTVNVNKAKDDGYECDSLVSCGGLPNILVPPDPFPHSSTNGDGGDDPLFAFLSVTRT